VRNVAVGNLFPQSQGALGTYVRGQVPFNEIPPFNQAPGVSNEFNLFGTGFGALWEADFWGRYRRNIIARQSLLNASVENYRDALVMLVSDVARSYIQYRTFQQRLDYARRNVAIQKGTLDLAETRFRAGTATNLDVQQAESSLELTESTIPQLEIGLRQSANSVCVLLGMPVGDLSGMLEVHPIPHAPPEVAVGIPADLLRRRPDVRRAEREVAAQSEQIGIAQANLYPHIGIGGFMGYASTDLKDLFQSRSFTGFIFPTLQWNILNYGRILNDVRAKDATFRGKVLSYQQTVLRAGREVEDALVAFLKTQRQAWRLQKSTQAAQKAVDLVTEQYEGGIADFNRVYNTQTTLVTQQDLLAQARGNIALYLVAVYQALGGGWQSFGGPGQPPAPPSLAHHHGPHP
jgi:NodT family efflux transporter outer membrane factor (OMF) lipoprotein